MFDGINQGMYLIVGVVMLILAIAVKPLRKTLGLLTVILGGLACLTGIGIIIGIPMILVGGVFLFV